MEPISLRVLLRNPPRSPAYPGAERAVILLGETGKTIGDVSYLATRDGVDLLGLRFSAPGFRQWATDPPLEAQQDAVVAALFGGQAKVRRQPVEVAIEASRGVVVASAPTWEAAFKTAASFSRAFNELVGLLADQHGEVRVLTEYLSAMGVQRLLELPGAIRQGNKMVVLRRKPSQAVHSIDNDCMTDEQREVVLALERQGHRDLAEKIRACAMAEAVEALGHHELAAQLRAAVGL